MRTFPSILGAQEHEGKVVKISDRVVYINHDIDDAIRAGIISEEDLPEEAVAVVGRTHSERIGRMVMDIVEFSDERGGIGMSGPLRQATDRLKDYLFAVVYGHDVRGITELKRAGQALKELFRFYMDNPTEIHDTIAPASPLGVERKRMIDDVDVRARAVCDFISGMTDRYAQRDYDCRFGRVISRG